MHNNVLLAHGSGGKLSRQLIEEMFFPHFKNPAEIKKSDAATLPWNKNNIVFTTDSFVVDPLFFPGGNIGTLAVSGTINDLAVAGAIPKYLSAGFIIEEGLPMADLEKIVTSMAEEAEKAGVFIVTGDTKVVDKGKCDKLFINTAGVGESIPGYAHVGAPKSIQPGDKIIINGFIADHGMAVLAAREGITVKGLVSDVCPLNRLIAGLLKAGCDIRFMRDATRGGLATVLNEMVIDQEVGILIDETPVPVRENVRGICEMLGFDPLYVANEGKVVLAVSPKDEMKTLEILQKHDYGKGAATIGEVTASNKGMVVLNTRVGGQRIIDMLTGDQLPRIC